MGKRLKPSIDFLFTEDIGNIRRRTKDETFYEAFKSKYPKYVDNITERFLDATGCDMNWENIDLPNLEKFVHYLKACGLGENSINQYCHKVMAVLNLYRTYHKCIPTKEELSVRLNTETDDSYDTFLNDDDLDLLYEHLRLLNCSVHERKKYSKVDTTQRHIEVLTHFLISADTGARSFDETGLSWRNLSDGEDSEGNPIYVLTYTTNKRGIKATVPLRRDSRVIPLLRSDTPLTVCHRECNKIIKDICRDAGLTDIIKRRRAGKDIEEPKYKAIHFHIGRKSFCTNSIIRGTDLVSTMRFMGHSNPKQTMKYNCSGPKFDANAISNQRT